MNSGTGGLFTPFTGGCCSAGKSVPKAFLYEFTGVFCFIVVAR